MNIIEAIVEVEAVSFERAQQIARDCGFEDSQFALDAGINSARSAKVINVPGFGYIFAGHSGYPSFSEDLSAFFPAHNEIGAGGCEAFCEAAIRLGLYDADGFSFEDEPWKVFAVQRACVERAEHGTNIVLGETVDRYIKCGETTDDGIAMYFKDGSVYYADGGCHECWSNASDFESERGFDASDIRP